VARHCRRGRTRRRNPRGGAGQRRARHAAQPDVARRGDREGARPHRADPRARNGATPERHRVRDRRGRGRPQDAPAAAARLISEPGEAVTEPLLLGQWAARPAAYSASGDVLLQAPAKTEADLHDDLLRENPLLAETDGRTFDGYLARPAQRAGPG